MKRIGSTILKCSLLILLAFPLCAYALNGDADGSGVVDIEDARYVARFLVNQIPAIPQPGNADATQDGKIDMEDSFAIAKYVAGQSRIVKIAPLFGSADTLHVGDQVFGPGDVLRVGNVVRIEIYEHFFALDISDGSVRVTQASTGYDSGIQPLTFEQDGRSLYYHWDTAGLDADPNYAVTITIDSNEMPPISGVALIAPSFQPKTLAAAADAFCPAPGVPLVFRRVFPHDSTNYPYLGPLGRGWVHNYNIYLTEFTDGRIAFHGPQGFNRFFESKPEGSYEPAPGDYGVLTRDANGIFQLEEKNGFIYRFRSDLRLDYKQDLNGNRITAIHDSSNNLVEIQHSCGNSFYLQYNSDGRIAKLTDHAGRVTNYQYDPNKPVLTNFTGPAGFTTEYDYLIGQTDILDYRLTKVTFPDGTETNYQYDPNARVTQLTGKGGVNPVSYSYDPNGRTHISDALGNETIIVVNERGQPTEICNPLGAATHYTYDAAYNLSEVNDPLGRIYSYQYDEYGNLIQTNDPNGNTIHFSYDALFHKLASLEDKLGRITTFEYDSQGNLLTITYPDASTKQYTYDSSGSVASKSNRKGQTITYTYNSQGQLTQKDLPDGNSCVYTYDPNGNLASAINNAITVIMTCDVRNQLAHVEYPGGFFLHYEYDGVGKRTHRMDQDGREANYEYDTAGRLIRMYDVNDVNIVIYEYDAAGRRVKKTLGNGVYTTYEYDAAGQILHLINYHPNDTILSRFDYTYDLTGNRLSMNTLEGLHQYVYDKLGQLAEVNYPDGRHVVYQYDSTGNRIQVIDNNSTTAYVANNLNQYTSVGGYACSYDLNGNLTQRSTAEGTFNCQYDCENRLITVSSPNDIVAYVYDAFGRRIMSDHNGLITNYVLDPIGFTNVAAEYDGGWNLIARYDHDYGLLRRTDTNSTSAYYTFDAIGSTSELTNVGGGTLNIYTYDVFGEVCNSVETVTNPFQYLGHYGVMCGKNSLFFMRARFYDPGIGRFLTLDPRNLSSGDINFYRYCFNDPVNFIDPTGHIGGAAQLPEGYVPSPMRFALEYWDAVDNPDAEHTPEEVREAMDAYLPEDPEPDNPTPEDNPQDQQDEQEQNGEKLEKENKPGSPDDTYDGLDQGVCPTFIQPPLGKKLVEVQTVTLDNMREELAGKMIVPIDGSLLRSDIPIYGIAGGKQFKNYRVEYGEGSNPTKWYLIEESNEPRIDPPNFKDISWMQGDLDLRGNLATWNVGLKNWSHLPWHPPEDPTNLNGVYTIRLVVEGKDGKTVEDQVTCEVGRAIAQCLPGIAISPDKRVIMRFGEQALTHPFRVYTILPLSDVGESVPAAPKGCKFIGSIYRVREPGDKFAKDVTLEFTTVGDELKNTDMSHVGICCYDVLSKNWIWIDTGREESANKFRTVLTELPTPKAIYALAHDPATKRSTVAATDILSPIPAEPVEPCVLVNCTFEKDFGTFKLRDRFVGAKLVRDNKSTPDKTYCLKLINENQGGNFSCTVLDKLFDITEYPDMHFNYRIGPSVKIDFLLKVNGRWYRLRFTGDEIDYPFRDVNIDNLGTIPEVVTDNKWRTAVVDLHKLLRQKTRNSQVDEIVLADWSVGGFMKLDFGRNRRDASFYIDNFSIFGRPVADRSPVLLVDNFDSSQTVNTLGGVTGAYKASEIPCFESEIVNVAENAGNPVANEDKDKELRLSFNMQPRAAYGGYWTALVKRDLSEYNSLRFSLRTQSAVPAIEVGIKDINSKEGRALIAHYASAPDENAWRDVSIPLSALKGRVDLVSPDVLFLAVSHKDKSGKATVWIDDIRFERAACDKIEVADFETVSGGEAGWSTHQSGAAAISASLMPDTTMGPKAANTVCRISYGGTIGHDYGPQGGFSYCAWQHSLNGFDARQFTYLMLRIRGERGGEAPNIYLNDCVKRVPMRAKEMPKITKGWQTIRLPLSHYAKEGVDLSHLEALAMVFEWDEQSGTVYVDDIGFER